MLWITVFLMIAVIVLLWAIEKVRSRDDENSDPEQTSHGKNEEKKNS